MRKKAGWLTAVSLLLVLNLFVIQSTVYALDDDDPQPQPRAVVTSAHQNMKVSSLSYSYTRIGTYDWSTYVSQAATAWNNAGFSGTNFPQATKPSLYKVGSGGSVRFESKNYGSDDFAGQHGDGSSPNTLRHYGVTTIKLNDWFWSVFSTTERRHVPAHELGHRFGLADITNSAVLMHYSDYSTVVTPQFDDRNGLSGVWNLCQSY